MQPARLPFPYVPNAPHASGAAGLSSSSIQPAGANAAYPSGGYPSHASHAPHGYASPIPPSPFSLEVGKDEDVALFQDARAGFSHLLAGRPALGPAGPNDPPADAVIHLHDAPITIRYKLEQPSLSAGSAAELARLTAERFASWRAQCSISAELANPTWLVSWGAEGAAVAAYNVAPPPGSTPPRPPPPIPGGGSLPPQPSSIREDLFVLVRQGMVYLVTWTYPVGFTDDPAYASFAAVAEATMVWDPMRWEQQGRVWPESPFVGPGIHTTPKPRHTETTHLLSRAQLGDDERNHLLVVLSGIVSGAGAPWVQLRPDVLDANRHAIVSAFRDPQLRSIVDGAFAEVQTAHDLRGLAVLLGRALDGRRSARPGSPRPPHMTNLTRG